jgi:hypothetical protein
MRAPEEIVFLLESEHIEADPKNYLARGSGADRANRRNDENDTATA